MRAHQNTWGRVSQAWKRGWKVDDEAQSFCSNKGFWCGCQCICRQTMVVRVCMHDGFPTGKWSRQSWCHYVMSWGSLVLDKGGKYIRKAWPDLGAVVTVVWVSWYKALGFVNKPQILYLSCIGAPCRGSITRMNLATCLSICMHPDFAGGL